MRPDGGPAFPESCVGADRPHEGVGAGMSLRDYFAAKAMQGDCARNEWAKYSLDDLSSWAYMVADAMLAARSA